LQHILHYSALRRQQSLIKMIHSKVILEAIAFNHLIQLSALKIYLLKLDQMEVKHQLYSHQPLLPVLHGLKTTDNIINVFQNACAMFQSRILKEIKMILIMVIFIAKLLLMLVMDVKQNSKEMLQHGMHALSKDAMVKKNKKSHRNVLLLPRWTGDLL